MIKKLFSHSLIYGLAPQVASIAGIFALPIITKDLTKVDFGVWGTLMAYSAAFQALSSLGLSVVLSNAFFKSREQYKWLWRQIYGFLLLWSVPYTAFLAIFLYLVIPEEAQGHSLLLLFLLLAPNVLFGPTRILGIYYFQLNLRPVPIAIRTMIFGILTVGLNIYTISYLKLGYMGWAWTFFLVTILSNASYWYPINITLGYKPIFNFKWRTIKKALKVSFPTIPHTYSSFLLDSSDRIVMDQLSIGMGDLGKFNLAAKFGGYFRSLAMATNRAVSPMMQGCYRNNDDLKARNLIFTLQVFMLGATFIFSLWSKEIFAILIQNEELNKVYPLAIIIVMATNYRPMYSGALNKLYYVEQTQLLWRISFIAGFMNIVLNIILIPIWGFEIAAYTTFASLMYMGFSGHFIKKVQEFHNAKYYPLFWLTVIILLTVGGYWMVEFDVIYKIIVTTVCGIVGAVGFYKYRAILLRE